jgi:hypothetical protein
MASVVKRIHAAPECTVDLTYDNVAMRAESFRVEVFPGYDQVRVFVIRDSDGQEFGKVFSEGVEIVNLPGGAAGRIDLSFNERGGLNGYAVGSAWPI